MNVKRYVNGKPVNETEFKTIEIRSKNTVRILTDVFNRINSGENEVFRK